MHTTLRLCSHVIALAGLVGGVLVGRSHVHLPPPDASGEALGVTIAAIVVVVCVAWLVSVSLVYVVTVRTRHEYVARTCLRLMPRFLRRLLEIALVTSAATAPA